MVRLEVFDSGEEYKQSYDNAGNPADRPYQIQESQITLHQGIVHHIHPEEPESTHEYQGSDCGYDGSSHATQSGSENIVNAADKICTGN